MLTPRQQLTIEHLREQRGIKTADGIVSFCKEKITKIRLSKEAVDRRKKQGNSSQKSEFRKHSKAYYQNIINHFS